MAYDSRSPVPPYSPRSPSITLTGLLDYECHLHGLESRNQVVAATNSAVAARNAEIATANAAITDEITGVLRKIAESAKKNLTLAQILGDEESRKLAAQNALEVHRLLVLVERRR